MENVVWELRTIEALDVNHIKCDFITRHQKHICNFHLNSFAVAFQLNSKLYKKLSDSFKIFEKFSKLFMKHFCVDETRQIQTSLNQKFIDVVSVFPRWK